MNGLHPLDLVVIGTYLVVVFAVGWRSQRRNTQDQEGFFLAGRKLGKVTQFFLGFGPRIWSFQRTHAGNADAGSLLRRFMPKRPRF